MNEIFNRINESAIRSCNAFSNNGLNGFTLTMFEHLLLYLIVVSKKFVIDFLMSGHC